MPAARRRTTTTMAMHINNKNSTVEQLSLTPITTTAVMPTITNQQQQRHNNLATETTIVLGQQLVHCSNDNNNNKHRRCYSYSSINRSRDNRLHHNLIFINLLSFTVIYIIISSIFSITNGALLQGCNFDNTLCEQNEVCIPDGLFGQCYSDAESEVLKPLIIDSELDAFQYELFRLEMKRLANHGLNWPHARAQCTLAYFKLSVIYDLDYDPQFCSVRNPNNIWALVQEVQNILATEKDEQEKKALVRNSLLRNNNNNADNNNILLLNPIEQQESNINNNDNSNEDDGVDVGAAEEPLELPRTRSDENAGIAVSAELIPIVLVNENSLIPITDNNADESAIIVENSQLPKHNNESTSQETGFNAEKRSIANGQVAVDFENIASNYGSYQPRQNLVGFKGNEQQAAWDAWIQSALQPSNSPLPELSDSEEKQLDAYVTDILNNKHPNLNELSNKQLEKLIAFINSLKEILQEKSDELEKDEKLASAPELEEIIPLTSQNNEQQLLLKKDDEEFNNADMGLSNTVHKIVKGGLQRVEGNRVYLKVADSNKKSLKEKEFYKLIDYLDKKIAEPNNLFFDEFAYSNGQLSFRISRLKFLSDLQKIFDELSQNNNYIYSIEDDKETKNKEVPENTVDNSLSTADVKNNDSAKKGTELESASGVAQAVFKRRKDIQTLSGIEVDETGIGSGVNVVPVEQSIHHNWMFLAFCGISIATVCTVLAVHLARSRGFNGFSGVFSKNKKYKNVNLPEVIDHLEGKPATIYEDLCRQRMNVQEVPISVNVGCATSSKHSSISSWPDDSVLQSSNLDISTGHVILGFLNDCLEKPEEISNQWNQLGNYKNTKASTKISSELQNANKNYDNTVLPYDDSLITVQLPQHQRQRKSSDDENGTVLVQLENNDIKASDNTTTNSESRYINASKIFDADPRQIAYIAAQTPLQQTSADFWQMIWQEGIVLIVNLCDQANDQQSNKFVKYWPEEGSKVFGIFEVYLVSEHIWSENYVVRSLYLKNLETNVTRTITQFHYLTWPANSTPDSIKSLLEFRRKVNKSYRGHASPVLVHCTNGAGRTGTYCLIDMIMNRILKGVKELNIAGSLEHLRDQRMQMVENEEQYKLVFQCVAEEVSSLLKNLQH